MFMFGLVPQANRSRLFSASTSLVALAMHTWEWSPTYYSPRGPPKARVKSPPKDKSQPRKKSAPLIRAISLDKLTIRAGPSLDSAKVGKLSVGKPVLLLDKQELGDGTWRAKIGRESSPRGAVIDQLGWITSEKRGEPKLQTILDEEDASNRFLKREAWLAEYDDREAEALRATASIINRTRISKMPSPRELPDPSMQPATSDRDSMASRIAQRRLQEKQRRPENFPGAPTLLSGFGRGHAIDPLTGLTPPSSNSPRSHRLSRAPRRGSPPGQRGPSSSPPLGKGGDATKAAFAPPAVHWLTIEELLDKAQAHRDAADAHERKVFKCVEEVSVGWEEV